VSEIATVGARAELETRQERAARRIAALSSAFQTVFETLADIYRDEDWRYINDGGGRPYPNFTAFVADQLGCASSNARRYQQGITSLVLPLQEIALPGARIPVTSADVVRLGVTGAKVVVEEAAAALEGVQDCEEQTAVLRDLIDTVAKKSTAPGFGPVAASMVADSPLGALVPSALPQLPAGHTGDGEDDEHGDGAVSDPFFSEAPSGGGRGGSEPVWVSESADAAGQRDSTPAGPALQPPPESRIDFGGSTPAAGGDDEPAPRGSSGGELAALEAAISAILDAADPAALAGRIPRSVGTSLAGDCAKAAQRLARLGQVLRSLAA
jgi:hypothetical protein